MESYNSQNFSNPVPTTTLRVRSDLYPSTGTTSITPDLDSLTLGQTPFTCGGVLLQSQSQGTYTPDAPQATLSPFMTQWLQQPSILQSQTACQLPSTTSGSNPREGKLFVIGEALFKGSQLKTVTKEYPFPIKKIHHEKLFTPAGIQDAYLLARADLKVTVIQYSYPKSTFLNSTESEIPFLSTFRYLSHYVRTA